MFKGLLNYFGYQRMHLHTYTMKLLMIYVQDDLQDLFQQ